MSKKKLLLLIGGVVVIGGIVVVTMMSDTSKATEVVAETALGRTLVEQVSASGRIQPQTKVDITSEINGEIVQLFVSEGDYVESGQLLVVLDTIQLKSEADRSRYAVIEVNARLEGSRIQLAQDKEEYERQQRLMETQLTSEKVFKDSRYAYEKANSSYDASKAQAKQFKSALEKQLDNLSKARIVAPMNGVVTFLDCEEGEIAAAQTGFSQGRRLMTISNLDVFEVEVEVDETEITKVEYGQLVDIEVDAFPDTVFSGVVTEIGNTAITAAGQDQSTNFKVLVLFNERNEKIRPGMSATVDITTNSRDDVVSVPYSAIVMRTFDPDSLERARASERAESSGTVVAEAHAAEDDSTMDITNNEDSKREEFKGVFVIRDGKARFVEVETGIADRKNIEIVSGLVDGDSVIAGPYRILRTVQDGDDVKPKLDRDKGDK